MSDINDINERIRILVDYLGLNINSFSRKIGLDNGVTIGNIVGGRRSKPSYGIIMAILEAFDWVSPVWLLTGKGPMNVDKNEPKSDDAEGRKALEEKLVMLERTVAAQETTIELLKAEIERMKKG